MATSIIPVAPALNASSLSVSECETIEIVSVLSTTFFVRRKEYSVQLDAKRLVWERLKAKNDRNTVLIENILAVKPQIQKSSSMPDAQHNSNTNLETDTLPKVKQFTIFYAKRVENSSNPNKWRTCSQTFTNIDSQVCQSWIQTLQRHINGKMYSNSYLFLFLANAIGMGSFLVNMKIQLKLMKKLCMKIKMK